MSGCEGSELFSAGFHEDTRKEDEFIVKDSRRLSEWISSRFNINIRNFQSRHFVEMSFV